MRQRHARIRGDSERRGDAGDHFERNAGVGERFGLFAATAENEGIAALQPHHREPPARPVDKHLADLFLCVGVHGFLLPYIKPLGCGRCEFEQRVIGQMIVEDGVGRGEDAPALPGDQFGIAGPGAHEIYLIHRRDLVFRNGLTTFTPS